MQNRLTKTFYKMVGFFYVRTLTENSRTFIPTTSWEEEKIEDKQASKTTELKATPEQHAISMMYFALNPIFRF